jgi:hypothetical protein
MRLSETPLRTVIICRHCSCDPEIEIVGEEIHVTHDPGCYAPKMHVARFN